MKRFAGLFLFISVVAMLAACAATGRSVESSQRIKFTDGPDGARATMNDSILFEVNSSKLYKETDQLFDALMPAIQRTKGKIVVEGHTDSTGTSAHNMKLSQRRAEAVKAALVARQIDPSRIEARGYGATRPVIPNAKTPLELAQNRRAVIVFPGETVESIGGSSIEKTLSDISDKISGWLGGLFKKDTSTGAKD